MDILVRMKRSTRRYSTCTRRYSTCIAEVFVTLVVAGDSAPFSLCLELSSHSAMQTPMDSVTYLRRRSHSGSLRLVSTRCDDAEFEMRIPICSVSKGFVSLYNHRRGDALQGAGLKSETSCRGLKSVLILTLFFCSCSRSFVVPSLSLLSI